MSRGSSFTRTVDSGGVASRPGNLFDAKYRIVTMNYL